VGVSRRSHLPAVVDRLTAAGCVAAAEEAAELLAAAPDGPTLEAWLRRREQGEPLAWITGTVRFCGRTLHVAPGVYVPRLHTEELARRAASLQTNNGRAVDLCTGAGAVAAHLMSQVPTAEVVGIDLDESAAGTLGATAYLPQWPTLPSLCAATRESTSSQPWRPTSRPALRLLVEVGGDQDAALAPTLAANGFDLVTPWWDGDGDLPPERQAQGPTGAPDLKPGLLRVAPQQCRSSPCRARPSLPAVPSRRRGR